MIKYASMAGAMACLLMSSAASLALPLSNGSAPQAAAGSSVVLVDRGHGGHGGPGFGGRGPGGFGGRGPGPGSFSRGPGGFDRGGGSRFGIPHGAPGGFAWKGRPGPGPGYNHHHRGARFYPYYGYSAWPYYGYSYNYSYYDDCGWLRRRALETGSRYWWRRYEICRADY
jgi:hypothetical protein